MRPSADEVWLYVEIMLGLFFLATVAIEGEWWPLIIGAMQGLCFFLLIMAYAPA